MSKTVEKDPDPNPLFDDPKGSDEDNHFLIEAHKKNPQKKTEEPKPKEKPKADPPPVDDDDEEPNPLFPPPPKDKKKKSTEQPKPKEVQFSELRQQRDDARKEIEDLRKQVETLQGRQLPESAVDLLSVVKDEFDDDPASLLTYLKSSKEDATKTSEELEGLRKKVRELSIVDSQEWQEQVVTPMSEAEDELYAVVAGNFISTGKEGKVTVAHKEIFNSLVRGLVSDEGPKKATELTPILKRFSEAFKERTGEDFEMNGSVNDIMRSLRDITRIKGEADTMMTDWESSREKLSAESKAKTQEERRKLVSALQENLKEGTTKAFLGYRDSEDYGKIADVVEMEGLQKAFMEAYDEASNAATTPEGYEPPPWDQLVLISAKGRMFDALAEKYAKVERELSDYKDAENDGISRLGKRKSTRVTPGKGDDDGDEVNFLDPESPLAGRRRK